MGLTQSGIDEMFSGGSAPEANTQTATAEKAAPAVPPAPVPSPRPPARPDTSRILGMTVPVSAVLAERDMAVEAILEITVGTIIEFEKQFDQELDLHVANRRIGAGYAVKVGENFGLRISRIEPVENRINALGPGG